jgi:type IV/VI secretion system ImpK/VasF family protein
VAARSLARLAGDYLAYAQLLAQAPPQSLPAADQIRRQLQALLEPVSKGGDNEGIAAEEIEEARFALVVFADEILLRRDWPGRVEWQRQPLQMHLYRTSRGGNEFFEHLARLRPEQNSAREIYFLVLVFGFEGQYAGQEAERQALIAHQFETLRAAGVALDAYRETPLTPPAYELEIGLPSRGGRGILAWLGVMVLGLAAIFAVLWVILYFTAGDVPLPRGV